MKKIIALLTLVFLSIFLYSCDYPEKSFVALRELDIPIEVTEDFVLPRGAVGKFIWTSNNESIVIDDLNAKVTQTNEDVLVILTATINQTSKTFEVLVLKTGGVSVHDRAKASHETLSNNYHTLTNTPLLMPNILNDVYIKYENSFFSSYIGSYTTDDNNFYLANNFKEGIEGMYIIVYYYKDLECNILVYVEELYLTTEKMEESNEFNLALKELNINKYDYSNGVIEIKNVKVNDYIEFNPNTNIDFIIYLNPKIFKRITPSKFKIIKIPDNDKSLWLHLDITIGKMKNNIEIILYTK